MLIKATKIMAQNVHNHFNNSQKMETTSIRADATLNSLAE